MLKDLILKNRTYRRFFQEHKISEQELIELIDLARLSASPRNQQALKFMISCEPEKNQEIFQTLAWAGALPEWNGPEEGEKPSAYITILGDKEIVPDGKIAYNEAAFGIAAQSIMLGATEKELGGCMIANIKRNILRENLKINERYEILLVLAIGKPKEKVFLTEMPVDGNFKYFRDENQNHFVPKRNIDEIIIN
jgi:nitroreductase